MLKSVQHLEQFFCALGLHCGGEGFFLKPKFPLRNLSRFCFKSRFHCLFSLLDLRLRSSLTPRLIYAYHINTKPILLWPFVTGLAPLARSSEILIDAIIWDQSSTQVMRPLFLYSGHRNDASWGLWVSGISAVISEDFVDANICSYYTRYQISCFSY